MMWEQTEEPWAMGQTRHGNRCPTPEALVAYAGAEPMVLGTRQRIAAHLTRCLWCWEQVGVVQELLGRDLAVEVAEAYRSVASGDALLYSLTSLVRRASS